MRVLGIYCDKCHQFVYSRAHHDFNSCKCGRIAIDGGRDYCRIVGDTSCPTFNVEVGYTERQLFEDWNKKINKLGFIDIESVDLLTLAQ